ncbi:hypothetical protein BO78DRAFT_417770 [Aspergillus sclerotiicarbonarius CBS 121057]|uniref:Uncharacterized protein n=1 Tax=Aspergillus sclerotiicarbonarius (strain CBS 121057 / IBT 28362) TaxID=1448318 RepID=A0A319EBD5_ASPSB|nr:hypothetical protein BO78DRAFT_417770 [Aspergillus sclerotiicarbonarius CBS 121057]
MRIGPLESAGEMPEATNQRATVEAPFPSPAAGKSPWIIPKQLGGQQDASREGRRDTGGSADGDPLISTSVSHENEFSGFWATRLARYSPTTPSAPLTASLLTNLDDAGWQKELGVLSGTQNAAFWIGPTAEEAHGAVETHGIWRTSSQDRAQRPGGSSTLETRG